jgi:hypothetical protein
MWANATLLSVAQTTAPVSTATTTVFASNSSTEFSCTSQNIALGAGLGVPLGLAVIAATISGFLLYKAKRAQHHDSNNQPHGYEAREPPQVRSVKELPGSGVSELSWHLSNKEGGRK